MCKDECCGHGILVNNECICFAGWFNEECDENLMMKWKGSYYGY